MTTYKIGTDRNGKRIVKVQFQGERGFSIQTNQNLPDTHRNGVTYITDNEVSDYVKHYGTKRQREMMGY